MDNHTKSDETLTHFQCHACKMWWTIGDFYKYVIKEVFCPWCGAKGGIQ